MGFNAPSHITHHHNGDPAPAHSSKDVSGRPARSSAHSRALMDTIHSVANEIPHRADALRTGSRSERHLAEHAHRLVDTSQRAQPFIARLPSSQEHGARITQARPFAQHPAQKKPEVSPLGGAELAGSPTSWHDSGRPDQTAAGIDVRTQDKASLHAASGRRHDADRLEITAATELADPISAAIPTPPGPHSVSPAQPAWLSLDIPHHPAGSQWADRFVQQFTPMLRQLDNGAHQAELRLDPPELGPVRIVLNINDTVVHASFAAAHAGVRTAIENALPQLQAHLEREGLSLGQTNVGSHAHHGHDGGEGQNRSPGSHTAHQNGHSGRRDPAGAQATTTMSTVPAQGPAARAPHSLINTFA